MEQTTRQKLTAKQIIVLAVVVPFVAIVLCHYALPWREAVPDHARFFVYVPQKWIVPIPVDGKNHLFPIPEDPGISSAWVTWKEIRNDNRYKDYVLPPDAGWDDFKLYGREYGFWRSFFLKPESRWTSEGFWRY